MKKHAIFNKSRFKEVHDYFEVRGEFYYETDCPADR